MDVAHDRDHETMEISDMKEKRKQTPNSMTDICDDTISEVSVEAMLNNDSMVQGEMKHNEDAQSVHDKGEEKYVKKKSPRESKYRRILRPMNLETDLRSTLRTKIEF